MNNMKSVSSLTFTLDTATNTRAWAHILSNCQVKDNVKVDIRYIKSSEPVYLLEIEQILFTNTNEQANSKS